MLLAERSNTPAVGKYPPLHCTFTGHVTALLSSQDGGSGPSTGGEDAQVQAHEDVLLGRSPIDHTYTADFSTSRVATLSASQRRFPGDLVFPH